MNLSTVLREFWRLIRNNKFKIFIGALIITAITVGLRYSLTLYVFGGKQEAVTQLEQTFDQEPAIFKTVITVEDGQIFSNAYAYDEFFTTPEVVQYIEQETGIAFGHTLQNEIDAELLKTATYRGSIAGIRDSASGIFTFRFLVGATAEENLAIAQAYRDLLVNQTIPFIETQNVNIILEPVNAELLNIDTTPYVATIDTLNIYRSNRVKPLIVYGVIGFVIGIIVMIVGLILIRIFHQTIHYAFEYSWDFADQHVLFNTDNPSDVSLKDYLPTQGSYWIVAQEGASRPISSILNDVTHIYQEVPVDELQSSPAGILVIIVQSHITTKNWYQRQLELGRLYHQDIRIIHTY